MRLRTARPATISLVRAMAHADVACPAAAPPPTHLPPVQHAGRPDAAIAARDAVEGRDARPGAAAGLLQVRAGPAAEGPEVVGLHALHEGVQEPCASALGV